MFPDKYYPSKYFNHSYWPEAGEPAGSSLVLVKKRFLLSNPWESKGSILLRPVQQRKPSRSVTTHQRPTRPPTRTW